MAEDKMYVASDQVLYWEKPEEQQQSPCKPSKIPKPVAD